MPEALTKKMFGLPRWAWLAILAAAIGVGLYLRHKSKQEEEEAEEGTGEEGPVGALGGDGVPIGEYPEDGGYYYAGGGQGGYGGYEGFNEAPVVEPPEIVVNIENPEPREQTPVEPLPLPTSPGDGGNGGGGRPIRPCTGTHPKPTAGHRYECVNGRWKLVPGPVAGPPKINPGGGPPNRPDNKKPSPPPTTNPQHPNAVNTGNKCVNGGVGPHTAPPGYHLFCDGGWIWRAPNTAGGGGGSPAPKAPAPPAPAPQPQPAPSGWCGHPNAVGVGQPCNYKDKHSPPAGWHWFCCNGALGRAPN